MTPVTERVGLLGWPVEHSLSAAMHNAAFEALGLSWRYDLLPARPAEFETRVAGLVEAGYRGFNVTVPHKRAALALPGVTEIGEAARATGAANTLTVQPDGVLHAANTDWVGFADDLRAQGIAVERRRCLILGTGGSAQAVHYALRQLGSAQVIFVSREPDGRDGMIGYEELAETLTPTPFRPADTFPLKGGREDSPPLPATDGRDRKRGTGGEGASELLSLAASEDFLIINCTPVGMWPEVDASPWPEWTAFPAGAILYDLVYNPPVTRLMAQAREAGARAIGGLGMLVRQGAYAFKLWTGIDAPLDVMIDAARRRLHAANDTPNR